MRFGRRSHEFVAPENFPTLTELQVAMLKRIHRENSTVQIRYARLMKEHVEILPAGMSLGNDGRREALALAQHIASLQRMIGLFGPLFLPGLPAELSPGPALAEFQRAAYSCMALAAPDPLPITVADRQAVYQGFSDQYQTVPWFRTVSGFPAVGDDRLRELLATADLSTYGTAT